MHYAGWCDKYEQLLGNVNPVASPHFNFTVTEPMGVIALVAPDEAPLLALVTLLLPAITSGNVVIALASETQPYPAIVLGEMLAVKRVHVLAAEDKTDWLAGNGPTASLYAIRDWVEFKTTWHPVGA